MVSTLLDSLVISMNSSKLYFPLQCSANLDLSGELTYMASLLAAYPQFPSSFV